MFCWCKKFLAKKKQNYGSFVLKFGTKKKIFFTLVLTIYACKETLSVYIN